MTLIDFFLTPVYLILIYSIAYWVRSKITTPETKRYFIPALTVKLVGALAIGMIYQFYYKGGDTFNYYKQASIIWKAFSEHTNLGIKLWNKF